ncbi:phage head-tail joining protein [Phaeobacter porticola]|uniref:Uncharacterized protein n=1 Tax=Phaeobacter porticola TaxID=1844006 RepID=A0A1L3I8V8_9RHOB|nr:hypothetical protein [Phaeobacter porticola]APG48475.1 hypothetical protein PhaeoP97_03102 [Phaeobacter porticola]
MALTVAKLTQARDALMESRANGARSFTDQNGERVEFKSDSEMAKALAALDREIAALSGRAAPTTLHFATSKGTT